MPNVYLDKYGYPISFINEGPAPGLSIIVVIPCHNEPELLLALQSLKNCQPTHGAVEVIVVINESSSASPEISGQNKRTCKEAAHWINLHTSEQLAFHLIYVNDLPEKHAGVGLARKIGMDEAVRRFEKTGNPRGIIACFDADCTCSPNYLQALESHFKNFPKSPACSIYFEHPLEGPLPAEIYEGIVKYELFLRYYIKALKIANFPFAYQTIGSSMAVRSDIYQKQGGMNRKKAGEDFYFLHKVIPLGNFTELNETLVIPSPRVSDRVPFGTGKAINTYLQSDQQFYPTYHPQIFLDLKVFLGSIDQFFKIEKEGSFSLVKTIPESIQSFLKQSDFYESLEKINNNSPNILIFRSRFFSWMNGFKVLKFVHFARAHYYPSLDIKEAAIWALKEAGNEMMPGRSYKEILLHYRKLDRSSK